MQAAERDTPVNPNPQSPPLPAGEGAGGWGSPSLPIDFVNTLDWRGSAEPIEALHTCADLLAWSLDNATIDDHNAVALQDIAAQHPDLAVATHARAITLREAAYRLLLAHTRHENPPPADLALINTAVQAAFAQQRLAPVSNGFAWQWSPHTPDLARLIWPIALAVAALLVSPDLARLRACEGPGCGWLFIDTTRNRSRRWCSMETCGNRAKARRHYERQRASTTNHNG